MMVHRISRVFLGAMLLAAMLAVPACRRSGEDKEVQALAQKAAELDKLSQQAGAAGAEQKSKLKEAGVNDVRPDAATLQLTDEQKRALEERIKAEKNSSYQALLQEVLDKDKEIKELNGQIARLRAVLPKPDVARENDSHYGLALRFLRRKGIPEEKAKLLVSRVLIMDKLSPGFEVYHFYNNGVYGTWVAQGKAAVSPTELQAEEKAKIEGERDAAVERSQKLQEELADLNAQKEKITADIDALRTEKTNMIKEMESLSATNEAQKAKLNSVHYAVGNRKALERDKHYAVTISEDRTTATVKLLVKDRFRNEKVVFAVAD